MFTSKKNGNSIFLPAVGNSSTYDKYEPEGYYWSSTVLADNVAYALYVGSSSVNSEISYGKMYGFSVRCVAR